MTNYAHPSMRSKWLTATCPVCGKEYKYRRDYKPKTCNNGNCMRLFHHNLDVDTWVQPPPKQIIQGEQ